MLCSAVSGHDIQIETYNLLERGTLMVEILYQRGDFHAYQKQIINFSCILLVCSMLSDCFLLVLRCHNVLSFDWTMM